MHCLDEELYPIKFLELSGIENIELLKNTNLKDEDSLQSLQRRYLVSKSLNEDKVVFNLSSVFKEYVRNFC
jgi:hypothetical protein